MQTNIKNKRACPHRRTYLLCNAKRCRRGFSLMELLVVVAIIFIMTGVLVVQQNGKSKNKANLETAARLVANALRDAQTSALNGQQQTDASGNPILVCGYGIQFFDNNASGFSPFYLTPISGNTSCSTTTSIKPNTSQYYLNAIKLPSSVKVAYSAPGSNNSWTNYFFSNPLGAEYMYKPCGRGWWGVCDYYGMSSNSYIELQSTASTNLVSDICIYPGGAIKEGGVRTTSDPNPCL